jgi:poly(3-hydroxyoctanoate) depolymerase
MESEESVFQIRDVEVGFQRLRVAIRPGRGEGTPLVICSGLGANLEVIKLFISALDGIETIAFDVPGIGGSPAPLMPYRFWGLACLVARLLDRLGYREVDVLGVSWGGGLAQQFALQYPRRCRRLILAATSAGAISVPGRLSVLSKMLTPRRFFDPSYMARISPEIYGGEYRKNPDLAHAFADERGARPPSLLGYYYQMFASMGWTSLPWLPLLRQPTLVLAGSDDPIVPVINARILASLIPGAQLHVVDCGHLFLVTRTREIAPVIRQFLAGEES